MSSQSPPVLPSLLPGGGCSFLFATIKKQSHGGIHDDELNELQLGRLYERDFRFEIFSPAAV